MKARIVRIGNSRGVRLPKLLLEEAGLGDEVELKASQGAILISATTRSRAGWAKAAQLLHGRQGDRLLGSHGTSRFDRKKWQW